MVSAECMVHFLRKMLRDEPLATDRCRNITHVYEVDAPSHDETMKLGFADTRLLEHLRTALSHKTSLI